MCHIVENFSGKKVGGMVLKICYAEKTFGELGIYICDRVWENRSYRHNN